jgi:hypothetical protein
MGISFSRFLTPELASFVLQQSSLRLYWRHPHRWASIRTLNGPLWARCNLGSDFKPGSITDGDEPGLLGCCNLYRAISKDRPVTRNHPNKAVLRRF